MISLAECNENPSEKPAMLQETLPRDDVGSNLWQ